MLTKIKGTKIPVPIWSQQSPSMVLRYYDGPRLLLQRSLTGQLFLAWWRDSDDHTDRWLYLPSAKKRLRAVLSGKITTLEALRSPEDSFLYIVDIDVESDTCVQTIMTSPETLPQDTLPRPGSKLNIPIPEEFVSLSPSSSS